MGHTRMMKFSQLKRVLLAGVIGFSIVGAAPVTVLAYAPVVATEDSEKIGIEPHADVLQTHFRTLNGVLQFRIWNATRARWENSWTNV